jgi:hypothetical protein
MAVLLTHLVGPAAVPPWLAGTTLMLVATLMTWLTYVNSTWRMLQLASHLLLATHQLQVPLLVQMLPMLLLPQEGVQMQVRLTSTCK